MKNLKYYLIAVFILIPLITRATNSYAENSFFVNLNSITLWVSVAVAILATVSVFMDARKIQGGVLGTVYTYFGIGMSLIIAGMVVLIYKPWNIDFVILSLHDIFYIVGYLIVAIGAKKIIKEYNKNE